MLPRHFVPATAAALGLPTALVDRYAVPERARDLLSQPPRRRRRHRALRLRRATATWPFPAAH